MRKIEFHRAATLDEALRLKTEAGVEGRVLAGGTDLIVSLREQSSSLPPLCIIDITRLSELRQVGLDGAPAESTANDASAEGADLLRLGALATHSEIEAHPSIRDRARLLAQASGLVGSPQIRHRGTLGGNIVNASPCADTVPALLALEAKVVLRSLRGRREVSMDEFFRGPYRTLLAQDEILTEVRIPLPAPAARSSFVKLGRRRALSISRMSIAVVAEMQDGIWRTLRIAAGSVAPTPSRFPAVEEWLRGKEPTPRNLREAGEMLAVEMVQLTGVRWSTPYKEKAVVGLLRHALMRALAEE